MGLGDIEVYMKGDTIYSMITKKMRIYNGIVTTPVFKTKIVNNPTDPDVD